MIEDRIWIYNKADESEAEKIASKLGISKLLAKIFLSRGIRDEGYIRDFLTPSLSKMHDPFLLKDMDSAVDRIVRAIGRGERILIYGDYDVDGITSTSILYDFLSRQKADVSYYIPDRLEEGYGLSQNAIEKFAVHGPSLVITVDCGINSVAEVELLKGKKIDVIITDHHECKDIVPSCTAVINPLRPGCSYPFKKLAGVGVVYKLLCGLCIKMNLGNIHQDYLDLVALGTVADVVDLIDENRVIAKYGLEKLRQTERPGLKALFEVSGLKDREITSWSISFVLAPRINVAGRVGDAGRAVRLLTTENENEATKIAIELNEENKYRQEVETDIFNQAVGMIESDDFNKTCKVLVVAAEGWHHGIIGIVASKISEKYYKPEILISIDNNTGKGSGRSFEGFNLFKALCSCATYLDKFGGHELAAGLTIQAEKIQEFRKAINNYADSVMKDEDLVPKVRIDVVLNREDISLDNVRELEILSPFGAGNPCPVFAYNGIRIQDIRTVGGNKHLKLKLQDDNLCIDAIGFNMGSLAQEISELDLLDVACNLQINSWDLVDKVQLNLICVKLNDEIKARNMYYYTLDKCIVFGEANDYNKDIIKGVNLQGIEELVPERDDLAAVYQYIRAAGEPMLKIDDLFSFASRISKSYRLRFNYFKIKKCLEILQELGLLENEPLGEYGMIVKFNRNNRGKTNLENSFLYRRLQKLKEREVKQN